MVTNQREFDKIYSITYKAVSRNYTAGERNYFDGFPFLRNVKVKGITVSSQYIGLRDLYLSISDKKNNYVIQNYPMRDLVIIPSSNKLRLFNIDGVDLLNSYFTFSLVPLVIPTNLFILNFYY